jgi:hypothetical protein
MIDLTDDVRQLLKDGLREYCDDGEICFRLMEPTGERVTLMLDVKQDGDAVVEDDGVILLLVEREVASVLDGMTLCIRETETGPGLAMSQRIATLSGKS